MSYIHEETSRTVPLNNLADRENSTFKPQLRMTSDGGGFGAAMVVVMVFVVVAIMAGVILNSSWSIF